MESVLPTGGLGKQARHWRRLAQIEGLPIIVVLLLLMGLFMIAAPGVFLRWPIYLSFLTTVPPMLVLAAGLTMVVAAGEIDLSFPSVLAFSGFLFAWAVGVTGSAWIGFLLAMAGGALVGFTNGVLIGFVGVPSIITTIGTQFFWAGVASILVGRHVGCLAAIGGRLALCGVRRDVVRRDSDAGSLGRRAHGADVVHSQPPPVRRTYSVHGR